MKESAPCAKRVGNRPEPAMWPVKSIDRSYGPGRGQVATHMEFTTLETRLVRREAIWRLSIRWSMN